MQGQTIGKTLDSLWSTSLVLQQQITTARNLLGVEVPAPARADSAPAPETKTRPRRRRRARLAEMTKWTANARARRVPQFVIEATGGLDTKKAIVAKFGEGARFEKGKPLPPMVAVTKAALKGAAPRRDGRAGAPVQAATA